MLMGLLRLKHDEAPSGHLPALCGEAWAKFITLCSVENNLASTAGPRPDTSTEMPRRRTRATTHDVECPVGILAPRRTAAKPQRTERRSAGPSGIRCPSQ